jgi:hypothetical protein
MEVSGVTRRGTAAPGFAVPPLRGSKFDDFHPHFAEN